MLLLLIQIPSFVFQPVLTKKLKNYRSVPPIWTQTRKLALTLCSWIKVSFDARQRNPLSLTWQTILADPGEVVRNGTGRGEEITAKSGPGGVYKWANSKLSLSRFRS